MTPLLLKLAEKTGSKTVDGGMRINMRLTKQDIADMVGSTVETSIRVMSRFEKAGLIKKMDCNIVIINKKELSAIARPA